METATQVLNGIDIDELTKALTGRDGGLRPSKPTTHDGLTQFVWRMARFHGGFDMCMPVMAHFWLQDYLDENGFDIKVTGVTTEDGKALTDGLDEVTTEVLARFGLSDKKAALRWQRAGLF